MFFRSQVVRHRKTAQKKSHHKPSSRLYARIETPISHTASFAEQMHIKKVHEENMAHLAKERPDLLVTNAPIACFTLQPISYEQMMKQGGFVTKDSLWIASHIRGDAEDACQAKEPFACLCSPKYHLISCANEILRKCRTIFMRYTVISRVLQSAENGYKKFTQGACRLAVWCAVSKC